MQPSCRQPPFAGAWPLLTGMSNGEKNFSLAVSKEQSASLRLLDFPLLFLTVYGKMNHLTHLHKWTGNLGINNMTSWNAMAAHDIAGVTHAADLLFAKPTGRKILASEGKGAPRLLACLLETGACLH